MPLPARCLSLALAAASLPPGVTSAPTATVAFPPSPALTDATEIHVTGTATDPEGVAAVRVNGVLATTRSRFSRWTALVPLSPDTHELVVETEDSLGHVDPRATSVPIDCRKVVSLALLASCRDGARDRTLAAAGDTGELVSIDDTGTLRSVLSPRVGGWLAPVITEGLTIGSHPDELLAASGDVLVRLDLATLVSSPLSMEGLGSGPPLDDPRSILWLDTHDGIVVVNTSSDSPGVDEVLWVDPHTGDRRVLSSESVGAGPGLGKLGAMSFDAAGERLIVTDIGNARLLAIDLHDGDRTTISSDSVGTGPSLGRPRPLALDADATLGFTVDDATGRVLEVELATGRRTVLGVVPLHTWNDSKTVALELDPASHTLRVVGHDRVLRFEIATGAHTTVVGHGVGSGPDLQRPNQIELDASRHLAWVGAGSDRKRFVRVELSSGTRSPLALATPEGDELESALALDDGNGMACVVWRNAQNQHRVARYAVGDGALIDWEPTSSGQVVADGLAWDAEHSRLLCASGGSIRQLDPVAWTAAPFSVAAAGARNFGSIVALREDAAHDAIWVLDAGAVNAWRVDPTTGARTPISGSTLGSGPDIVPAGLGVERDGDALTASLSALVRISRDDGSRVVVSQGPSPFPWDPSPVGSGPRFGLPLDVDCDGGVAYVVDDSLDSLYAVELESGDRVIVSH